MSLNMKRLSDVAKMVPKNPSQPAEAKVALSLIDTRPQVRKKFRHLEELAESIRQNGIIDPLVLHAEEGGRYRLIAGERRFRAAPLAGLSEVPVVIKRGLTEYEIRAIQIAENNDRDDLTAFEQAMGVIEDVENYGTREAMKIWNVASEGWISKRVAVKKYGDRTLEVLELGLSNDFEVLHCLNQIEDLDEKEFGHLRKRLEDGLPISRDEARNTLSRVKTWKKQQEEMAQRRKDAEVARAGAAQDEEKAASHEVVHGATKVLDEPAAGGKRGARPRSASPQSSSDEGSEAERKRLASQLNLLRDELFEWGNTNLNNFTGLQQRMTALDYELNQGEWVLWTGFLDTVLPMLHALGSERSRQYLKRLQTELKSKAALSVWKELHPAAEGRDDDESAPRSKVVDMPPGWRF